MHAVEGRNTNDYVGPHVGWQVRQYLRGVIRVEVRQHDGDDLRMLEPDQLGDGLRIHPLQGFQALVGAADVDTVDDAGGFVLAQRIHQHFPEELVGADAHGRLGLDG